MYLSGGLNVKFSSLQFKSAVAALGGILLSATAQATLVRYDFQAVGARNDALPTFNGKSFLGSFTFDTSLMPADQGDYKVGFFQGPGGWITSNLSVENSVGGYSTVLTTGGFGDGNGAILPKTPSRFTNDAEFLSYQYLTTDYIGDRASGNYIQIDRSAFNTVGGMEATQVTDVDGIAFFSSWEPLSARSRFISSVSESRYVFSNNQIVSRSTTDYRLTGDLTALSQVIDEPPPPEPYVGKNYGLFIGVQAPGVAGKSPDLRGDLAAQRLADAFSSISNSIGISIVGSLSSGDGIAQGSITGALDNIRSQMKTGDKIFVYVTGHGEFFPGGDETVDLGGENFGLYFTDDYLTSLLMPFNEFQKVVLIDSCHGGGFWGSSDPLETFDHGDLDLLSNVALLSSSSEIGLSYYYDDGIPLLSQLLQYYWSSGGQERLDFQSMTNYVSDWANYYDYEGKVVYEMGYGDPIILSKQDLNITSFKSQNFAQPVPEPQTNALMIVGFGIAGRLLRQRSKKTLTATK